jgi:hypothetical protein
MKITDEYFAQLEKQWRQSQTQFSDKELLIIFPEAKEVIPEKIKEWEERRVKIIETIKQKLSLIKKKTSDGFSYWFWREWVKVNEGTEALKIERHIARLNRLLNISRDQNSKKQITQEAIQEALRVPIEDIASQHTKLRKSGKNLVGLCPLHNEKHPSFYIYPETNSFFCYGCKKGGNVINFVKLLYGYSFGEAVKWLQGEK